MGSSEYVPGRRVSNPLLGERREPQSPFASAQVVVCPHTATGSSPKPGWRTWGVAGVEGVLWPGLSLTD